MTIGEFLDPAHLLLALRASDEEHLIAVLSRHAAAALSLDPGPVAEALRSRERLGSTGLGEGVALPHARLPGVTRPFGVLAVLKSPIDFAAIDERPVDIVLQLLLPAGAASGHLGPLATAARRLRDPRVTAGLRAAREPGEAWRLLAGE